MRDTIPVSAIRRDLKKVDVLFSAWRKNPRKYSRNYEECTELCKVISESALHVETAPLIGLMHVGTFMENIRKFLQYLKAASMEIDSRERERLAHIAYGELLIALGTVPSHERDEI